MKKIYVVLLLAIILITSCNTKTPVKNVKPIAKFTASQIAASTGVEISFDASESSDEDGTITSYSWDFGDTETVTGSTVKHIYNQAGSYEVKLIVTDNENGTSTITKIITITAPIQNKVPIAKFTASQIAASTGIEISFDASESSDEDGTITSYNWDFGDAETATGSTVKHIYNQAGSYEVSLTVKDDKNATNTITKTIIITEPDRYKPAVSISWQWQLTENIDGNINTAYEVEIYDLDLFDIEKTAIQELQARSIKVICYFSAGTYDNERSDADQFPQDVLGKILLKWPGERWLDIRSEVVRSIMLKRLKLAKEKGCDGVEPDNMDGYNNDSGFDLRALDQIEFNKFLAIEAHKLGLSVGLKNDLEQIDELVDYFDFAVNEECFENNECEALYSFIEKGKPVLNAEYNSKYTNSDDSTERDVMCQKSKEMNFSTLILPEFLDDEFRFSCL